MRALLALIAGAAMIVAARGAQSAAAPLDAQLKLDARLKVVAELHGEPSSVSAAGLTSDDAPMPTLENATAFDPTLRIRRLVLVGVDSTSGTSGGGNAPSSAAVIAFVRWFKTSAPPRLRQEWTVSALPQTGLGAPDRASVERWIVFQAPDLLVQVRDDGGTLGLASIGSAIVGSRDASTAIPKLLSAAPKTRSPLHDTIANRLRRQPLDIARLLAKRYPETPSLSYIPAVAWTSALRLATTTGDEALTARVRQQAASLLSADRPLFGTRIQLTSVAGTMVFADLAGDFWTRALEGARLAAARKDDGVAAYGQGWTDDMFMATAILARVGRDPAHRDALDAAARLLVDYAVRLQRADGIFIHAIEGPFAWGRGNGFAALGLMEALDALETPEGLTAAIRSRLLDIFRRQMAGALAHQAPDGMWREVIDEPGAYREETATAMLMTAMARGIRRGWIDRAYLPAVRRAWRGLAAHVREDGTVVDVCASTGAGPTRRYYLDRPAITGADDRGGAMALFAAMEMHELSRDFPAVAAQGVHELDGPFDQLGGLVHFFD